MRARRYGLKYHVAPHFETNEHGVEVRMCIGRKMNPDCLQVPDNWEDTEWCGLLCKDFCMFATHPGKARQQILERDMGICAHCGCDAQKLARVFGYANKSVHGFTMFGPARVWLHGGCNSYLKELGFKVDSSLWDVDHIEELTDGGSPHKENCQTLCVPCHKEKTNMMRRKRANNKRKK